MAHVSAATWASSVHVGAAGDSGVGGPGLSTSRATDNGIGGAEASSSSRLPAFNRDSRSSNGKSRGSLSSAGQNAPATAPLSNGSSSYAEPREGGMRRMSHSTRDSASSFATASSSLRSRKQPGSPRSAPRTPPTASTPIISAASHVQAVHDFDASTMVNTAITQNMYLPLRAGEVIRVLNRDPSGWWDGELAIISDDADIGERPRRGWFPSNYVRPYEGPEVRRTETSRKSFEQFATYSGSLGRSFHDARSRQSHVSLASFASHASHASQASYGSFASHASQASQASYNSFTSSISQASRMSAAIQGISGDNGLAGCETLSPVFQRLLVPVVQTLSLLQSSVHQKRRRHISLSAMEVIKAIKVALKQMDCLNRESYTLTQNPRLSQERRNVLEDLSTLVTSARIAGVEPVDEEAGERVLELVVKASRSLFAAVRKFMLIASEAGIAVVELDGDGVTLKSLEQTPQAPTRVRNRAPSASGIPRTAEGARMRSASVGDLRGTARRQEPAPPLPTSAATACSSGSGQSSPVSARTRGRAFSTSGNQQPMSAPAGSKLDLAESPESISSVVMQNAPQPPPSAQEANGVDLQPIHFASGAAVHEAVEKAEEALLSTIASFIGHVHAHHIDSHPTSDDHLLDLSNDTVDRIREVLLIAEGVVEQSSFLGVRPIDRKRVQFAHHKLHAAAAEFVERSELVCTAKQYNVTEEQYEVEKKELLQTTTKKTLGAGTECSRAIVTSVPKSLDSSDTESLGTPAAGLSSPLRRTHQGLGLGIRTGPSAQTLARRATSLGHLHKRYTQDAARVSVPPPTRTTSHNEDEEEVVADTSADEGALPQLQQSDGKEENEPSGGVSFDAFKGFRPLTANSQSRPTSQPNAGSAGASQSSLSRPSSETTMLSSRSRSTSLSTALPTTRGHRMSPSSVDITNDVDLTPRGVRSPTSSTDGKSFHLRSTSRSSTAVSLSSLKRASLSRSSVHKSTHSTDQSTLPDTPLSLNDDAVFPSPQLKAGEFPIVNGFTPPSGPAPARPPPPARSPALNLGDEKDGDVRFWVVAHDYDPREVAYNSDGVLVGGTLRVIVEKMTPHDGPPDTNFASAFWFTFRLFTTPIDLVKELVHRYELAPPPQMEGMGQQQLDKWKERKLMPVRLRVYNFIKSWIDQHWKPETDDAVLETLEKFAKETITPTLQSMQMGPRLVESIRRRMNSSSAIASNGSEVGSMPGTPPLGSSSFPGRSSSFERMRTSTITGMLHTPGISGAVPTPIISKQLHQRLLAVPPPTNVSILDFDPLELARQLTVMESRLFAAVQPEDLLMSGKKSIPALKALSTLSNQITGWVADGILNEQDAKHRAALLKFYIKLADKCLSLNNFSTLFAILAGLNSSTIMRLKKTWDALSVKYRVVMERLRGIIEHTKNHAAYRARLREVTGPCLPFLGLILTDITFTQDGNPNKRPSTLSPDLMLINQDKFTKLGRIAIDFKRYQMAFELKEVEPVQAYLQRTLAERGSGSLDALYRKSLLLEPRQGSERLSTAVEKPGWLGMRVQV